MKTPSILALLLLLATSCVNRAAWSPTVDPYGDPNAEYIPEDEYECRELATRVSGHVPDEIVKGGLFGSFLGAATGALFGAFAGDPGLGAAIGAGSGAIGGGTAGGLQADFRFQEAFRRCMYHRGHHVIG
jgi:outer membrane lipoprotein SlyB